MGVVFPCAAATQYEGLPDEQPLFYGIYVGQNKVGYLESGGYLLDHENGSAYFVAYNEVVLESEHADSEHVGKETREVLREEYLFDLEKNFELYRATEIISSAGAKRRDGEKSAPSVSASKQKTIVERKNDLFKVVQSSDGEERKSFIPAFSLTAHDYYRSYTLARANPNIGDRWEDKSFDFEKLTLSSEIMTIKGFSVFVVDGVKTRGYDFSCESSMYKCNGVLLESGERLRVFIEHLEVDEIVEVRLEPEAIAKSLTEVVDVKRVSDQPSLKGVELTFVEGLVEFLDGTMEYTRFRVVSNDAIIEVRNDTHLRFNVSSSGSARTIQILAPTTAVTVKDGFIPESYLKTYSISHYLTLKDQYEGEQSKSHDSKLLSPFPLSDIKQFFGVSRKQWEDVFIPMASSMFSSEFTVGTNQYDTGVALIAMRNDSSFGYTFQPFFSDTGSGMDMLLFTNWVAEPSYLGRVTNKTLAELEKTWQTDLGPSFELKVRKVKRDLYIGLEVLMRQVD